MDPFHGIERVYFQRFGLDSMFSLRQLKLKVGFFRVTIQNIVTFASTMMNLCPTFEELSIMLSYDHTTVVVFPSHHSQYASFLSTLSGLPIYEASSYM